MTCDDLILWPRGEEINMSEHSSSGELTKEHMNGFLVELANLRTVVRDSDGKPHENYEGAIRFLRINRRYLPPSFPRDSQISRIGDEIHASIRAAGVLGDDRTDEGDREPESLKHLFDLGRRLREAWDQPDLRKREKLLIVLQTQYWEGLHPGAQELADPPVFDHIMDHLREVANTWRAKHCANPDCPTPYFIAAKRSYKYCSPDCADPAQKQFKREWWSKNGPGWRKKRELKKASVSNGLKAAKGKTRRKHGSL
jgi:hypothetical protein